MRPLPVRAGAVVGMVAGVVTCVVASCSTGTTTSTETLTPTTVAATSTTLVAPAPVPPDGATTLPEATTTTAAATTTTPANPATTAPAVPTSDVAAAFVGGLGDTYWLPLGYWDGTAWVRLGEESETTPLEFPAASGDPLLVTGLGVDPAVTALGPSGEACFEGRIGFAVDVAVPSPDPPGFGYSAIGVVGDWPIQPRPARQVGLAVDEYRQIGATFADDLGVDGTLGEVVQVVRVDLDGDGMEEVLVAFEHTEDAVRGAPGDYSLVYARAPQVDGSVHDSIVYSSVGEPGLPADESPLATRARVLGVADLNGDGRMEVALHTWYYEGAGVSVFEFDGSALGPVMGNGCGP